MWNKMLADMIDGADDSLSLLKTAAEIWRYRHFEGAVKYSVPRLRGRLKELELKQPVVAIDFNNVAHRDWHGRKSLRETLRDIYRETSPGKMIFASDSFRKESSSNPPPPEFYSLMEETKEYIKSKGVQWEEVEGREADDILASIAFTCQVADLECVLVTTDSDLYQTLGPKTTVYNRTKMEYRGSEWLYARYGLTPKQWPDYLTLTEECAEWGPSTSMSALKAYGDVDGIHKNMDKLKPAKAKAISDFWPDYLRLRRKHFIERDIPVGW
jgi:5'-3' exonuclease